MRSMNRWLRLALVFVGVVVMSFAPAARAQMGMMGMGAGQDMITKRGVEAYAKILGLSPEQREVALTLMEASQSQFKDASKKFQDAMKVVQDKVNDTQDFSLYRSEMPKAAKEFQEKTQTLEKGFFADLKAACNDAQLANWSKVERYRRREKDLRFGFVSGAGVDLIKLVDGLKLKDNPDVAGLLDQYELEMDKNLQEFEKVAKQAEEDAFKGGGAMFDMGKAEAILKQFYGVSKDMRELNRTYARKVAQVMDDRTRDKFEDAFNVRSFPRVYKPAHVVKMMETAAGLADVSGDTKKTIATLKDGYEHDAAMLNTKWAKAIEEREDKAGGSFAAIMKSMQGEGGELNKDVNDARTARKELDQKTKDRLLAMLNEDQKAKMPEAPREDPNPFADFMPSGEDE